MISFLQEAWPVLGALAMVGAITYGALTPYIRKERARRAQEESNERRNPDD